MVKDEKQSSRNIYFCIIGKDQLTKISNIFCAEIDKPSNPQRQVFDEEIFIVRNTDQTKKPNQTEPIQPKVIETIEEDNKPDCSDIRRTIEQNSDYGYIVWPLIKPLLLGKILYAPATPVSNAIIAKVK